ncbi:hypothetical protein L198_04761 [Cryptococcus wingfieldii CBS 7118]|uniref:Uncharacterized protein n=1 Tax=Cryptococcus wingfieldii CBS 7118 TaxID=1295528 RepID=A0A1E3J3X6_9TREE|nr:hypothetical protein L198_04761 [Cryptococcus wingfieldii CBS 7118]ODN95365.1 hypothetical protein L198_04761 [Cryptococcus wingfieldii CBS 7118]
MAPPRPSKPTRRARRSRHPRDPSSRIELTTLEPLHPVYYIILDHLLHMAPATYIRLSKGLRDYGTARLSAPFDFDDQLVSRFHESVKKQQDVRWLFPITQSRTIRFPSYRLFATMVCLLSQVERQKRRTRKAGASYPCQYHPTPLFARATSMEIRLDEAVPLRSLFQQINAQLQLTNAAYAYGDMTSHVGPRFRNLVLHHISDSALSTLIRDCATNYRNRHICEISTCLCLYTTSPVLTTTVKLSISDSRFPEPSALSASLTSLLRSLTSKKPSKIIIDISGPTHSSLRQAVVDAIAKHISMMADSGYLSQAKMMRFEMTGRYELYARVWKKVRERRYGKDLMRVLRSIYKID